MALLASYMVQKEDGESLQEYLSKKIFGEDAGICMEPIEKDVEGFEIFAERYKKGIAIEQAAIQNLI